MDRLKQSLHALATKALLVLVKPAQYLSQAGPRPDPAKKFFGFCIFMARAAVYGTLCFPVFFLAKTSYDPLVSVIIWLLTALAIGLFIEAIRKWAKDAKRIDDEHDRD